MWASYTEMDRNFGTYVKDRKHALKIFNDFHFQSTVAGDHYLYTVNVKSLYTVIPNTSGLQALAHFLNKGSVFVLDNNAFSRLANCWF